MDPWGSVNVETVPVTSQFEDDFKPSANFEKLSDSVEYLAVLGR